MMQLELVVGRCVGDDVTAVMIGAEKLNVRPVTEPENLVSETYCKCSARAAHRQ